MIDRILNMASLKATLQKTTTHPSGNLTPRQVVRLAAAIPDKKMAPIAERYMMIPRETIQNISVENKDDSEAFNREIIKYWLCTNPNDQQQVNILVWYKSAFSLPQKEDDNTQRHDVIAP